MGYRIGSFNMRNLSYSTKIEELNDNKSTTRAYSTIGQIIRDNFDIVAMQEVMTDDVLKLVFPKNCGWESYWEQTFSKQGSSREGYAFAWNTQKIRPISQPVIWKQYRRDTFLGEYGLERHPLYGRFTPSGTPSRGPFCEIRIINTHIRFDPKINKSLPSSTVELRQRELAVLIERILGKLETKGYGNNMPAYTFLTGDYNLNIDNGVNKRPYISHNRRNNSPMPFATFSDTFNNKEYITIQDKPSVLHHHIETNPTTNERQVIFGGYSNNFDHFTCDRQLIEKRGLKTTVNIVDTVTLYANSDFEKHFREISDHIPIMLEINLK